MIQRNVNVVILTDSIRCKTAGPYRLATEARNAGYSCQVIDNFQHFTVSELESILNVIVGPSTMILGLSSTFYDERVDDSRNNILNDFVFFAGTRFQEDLNNADSLIRKAISLVKDINPNVKVVIGGATAGSPGMCGPAIDTFVIGPGDKTLVEYLGFITGKVPSLRFSRLLPDGKIAIDGINYHSEFDFVNCQTRYHPADNIRQQEILPIEIARGCIFRCKFCAFPFTGKKKNDYIKRSEVLKEEFLRNYHEYGITKYIYMDETHNDSVDKLTQLANVVQSLPFELSYVAYLRLDLLHSTPEHYQLLRDGGLKGGHFGIETLNYESAKIIGKGLHPELVIEELHKFADRMPHVSTMATFICGLPKETKDTITAWTETISDLAFPVDVVRMYPLIMRRNDPSLWVSEFSKSPDEHYTWKDRIWHNGDFDKMWAIKFTADLDQRLIDIGRQRVAVWTAFDLMNLGYGDAIATTPIVTLDKAEHIQRYRNSVANYKSLILDGKVFGEN